MPKVNIPGVGKVNFPDDMSHDDIVNAIENDVIPQYQQHLQKTGAVNALKEGWHSGLGAAEKYLGEVSHSDRLKQWAEENKAKAQGEYEETTAQDVANAPGILSTMGRQINKSALEPIAGIAGKYGAPALVTAGAAASSPFWAPEALGAAGIGAVASGAGVLAGLPTQAGETLERQESLGQKPDLLAATASGLAKSALFNLGMPGAGAAVKGVSAIVGKGVEAEAEGMARKVIDGELSHADAVASLSGYGKQLLRNTGINAVTGAGMMVGSEAADRAATGQSLTDADAMAAYGHNVASAMELAPVFGVMHSAMTGELGKAKATLADAKYRNDTINKINEDRYAQNLKISDIKDANRAAAEAAFRAADEAQRAQIRAQIKADPQRSILDIINEVTGVDRTPAGISSQKLNAHWNMPSGRFVSDPVTGIERELSRGELHQIFNPDFFPGESPPELTQQDVLPLASSIEQAREVQTQGEPQQDLFNPIDLPPLPNAPERQVPGIVTPKAIPTQQLIEQNLGIGAKRYKTNEANVEEAFNEPTGARVQKEGQIERPETEEDMLIRNYPDLFRDNTLTSLPPLTKVDLEHMGFTEKTAGYAPLLKFGKDPIGNADKINDLLDTHLKSNKTLNTEAIATYRSAIDAIRQNQGPDVSAEPGATGAAVEPSVSVPKQRGQRVARGATEPTPTDVGNDRVLASGADTGANAEPAPLVKEAPAVIKADIKAHDDALEKAYDLRFGEVTRSQVKSFADRLVRHGIIDEKQRESYAAMLRDKHTEAEDILSELETDVEISKERLQKGPKVESAKAGEAKSTPEDFIKSIYDKTPQSPFDSRQHAFVYDNGEKGAFFELRPSNSVRGAAEVYWFSSFPQREGVGTRGMQELQRIATEHNIPLTLSAWDKGVVSKAALTKFYKKLGFVPKEKGSPVLVWHPKTTEEARGRTEGGHTADTLRSELTAEFGEQGIGNLEKRGILNIHDTVEHAPEHIRSAVESDAIGAHSEGVTHLFADRIAKGEGRRGLLHEVGEHYGLKGMLGERVYNNLLDTIGKTAHKDPVIKEAIDHVARNYSELRDNPAQFAREVVARVGETAPTHTVWRRIVAGVKNFLVKMGLMKNLNARDIQDLIQHSLRTAMKRDIEAPKRGVEAARKLKELGAAWTPKRIQKLLNGYAYHGTKDGDEFKTIAYATKISPQQFLDITATKEEQRNVSKESRPLDKKDLEAFGDEIYLRVNLTNDPNVMEVIGHEGRHRMTALKNAGVKDVPISVVFGVPAGESYRSIEKPLDVAYLTAQRKSSVLGEGEQGAWVGDLTPINLAHQNELFSKYQTGDIEFAKKGDGKRLDGSPIKQHKPYTGSTPEPIRRFLEGEGSMWERLGRELGAIKNKIGVGVISKRYNIERKALDRGIKAVSDKVQGILRGDLIAQQADNALVLTHKGMQLGGLRVMKSGLIEAFEDQKDPANMIMIADSFNNLVNKATKEIGDADTAHDMISMAWVAPRYEDIIRNNERIESTIEALRAEKPKGYGDKIRNLEKQKKYVGDWDEHDRAAAAEAMKRYGPEIEAIRKTWNIMRGRTLDFMVETGAMSRELAEEYLDNVNYVPFYRIHGEEEAAGKEFTPLTSASLQNAGKQYRFKGSDKEQGDVMTNMMGNISWMMQKGIQNNAALALTRLEEQMGEGHWATPQEKHSGAGHQITVWRDGKADKFVLKDVNDAAAFAGNPVLTGMVWNITRKATGFLRHSVTMFPQFVWNQAWEDPIRAAMVSGNKAGILRNIVDTWSSIYKNQFSGQHQGEAEAMSRSGIIGQKDVITEKDIERQFKGQEKSGLRKSMFIFERLAQGSDLGARQSIYKNAMKELKQEGYDDATAHALATSRAIQYMPYQQVGKSRTMAYLRAMIPFVNSPIQGYARDIAAARGRISGVSKEQGKKMLAMRLAKYAAFIGAYAAFRSGDPDYENQDADMRDNYFFIGGMKIPAPQELRPFKAAIERGTRAYALNAPGADLESSDIGAAVLHKMWELTAGLTPPIPTVIRPIVEDITNYNIHSGHALVGPGQIHKEPYMQYTDSTSEISKGLGRLFNKSPIVFDNYLSGYGGYLGQTVEKFSNVIIGNHPSQNINDWLFVGSMTEPEFGRGQVTETYKMVDKAATVQATIKALKDEGKIDELKDYIAENRGWIGGANSINSLHQVVTNIRQAQNKIRNSNMDSDAMRAKLDELQKNEANALARVHDVHRRIVELNNAGS